jgi:parvulin-like peptidyl-prolyl isomerase
MILKRLAEDPEMKKTQIENLKQLLAFASQAQKEGLAAEPNNRRELENIRAEILAVNYDREINKDKGPMPAFGFITEDQVKAFWGDEGHQVGGTFWDKIGLGGTADTRTHEAQFEDFIASKIAVLKAGNPEMKDREITEQEKTQARDVFAKIRIYLHEYEQKAKAGQLPKEFIDKANLQVKLQQAQFLARLYSEKAAEKIKVTDEEIAKYMAEHPDLDPAQKKAKAEQILARAKAGEDFAALANEFSEDPGNKGVDGNKQGGLYKDVPKGRMIAAFEQAALALSPAQVAPNLVETDFGYHIIKLERALAPGAAKAEKDAAPAPAPNETYDVRHILISTGIKDEKNPMGRETPVKDFIRAKLEEEKEKKLLEEIVASNNISVPDDFSVPEITPEQMQEMQQRQQMQMPQMPPPGAEGEDEEGPKPPKDDKKAEPKKK